MSDGVEGRAFLRHTLATLAYRGGKVVRDLTGDAGGFQAGPATRTPVQILAHIGDLLDWALSMAQGARVYRESEPGSVESEANRFFVALAALDDYLASDAPLGAPAEKLFQGPIADALTHVGQIALLRGLADAPVRGENYFVADIAAGVVGRQQPPARREFE